MYSRGECGFVPRRLGTARITRIVKIEVKHLGPNLFAISLAALLVPPAAAADIITPRLLRINTVPRSGWVVADLDGDRKLDLASTGASRHEGPIYVQEISFRFSSLDAGTITVRTTIAAERLSARDLDGDADRDLVLEALNREPVAVLLNDGQGHFHQGNLDDFRFQLSRRDPFSLEGSAPPSPLMQIGECSTNEAASPRFSSVPPDPGRASLIAGRAEAAPAAQRSRLSTRGPPRHS